MSQIDALGGVSTRPDTTTATTAETQAASTRLDAQGVSETSSTTEHDGFLGDVLRGLGSVLHGLFSPSKDDQPKAQPAAQTNFAQEYSKDFSSWTEKVGDKGKLTPDDIDQLMQDPSIKGKDAATLASLKTYSDQQAKAGKQAVFNSEGAIVSSTDPNSTNAPQKVSITDKTFQNRLDYNQRRLAGASEDLFAHSEPDYKSIKQGTAGDCYFLSSLAGVAQKNPDAIKSMISQNKDGTYTVNFPGKGPVTVAGPTEAEQAAFATTGKDGVWGSVFEKAYGELKTQSGQVSSTTPDKSGIEAIEGASGGGDPADAIFALTGNSSTAIAFPPNQETASQLPSVLQNALQNGGTVVASTLQGGSDSEQQADGLPKSHAITVTGYDPATNTVTLRNPWGDNGPNGKNAPTDATVDPSNNGVFTMSLDNFTKDFRKVTVENTRGQQNGQQVPTYDPQPQGLNYNPYNPGYPSQSQTAADVQMQLQLQSEIQQEQYQQQLQQQQQLEQLEELEDQMFND